MSMPKTQPRRRITVEVVPDDATLVQQYGRACRALIAVLGPLAGRCDELETLRAVQRRAQVRLDQLDGEDDPQ
jgi:hypothetical protein